MAKRKRLTPADPATLAEAPVAPARPPASLAAPIAHVAGDAATAAALEEVTGAMQAARDEGRLILKLPLRDVVPDYLVRDRIASGDEEMQALRDSLERRGQQTPVEVSELEGGRYGLISGARRYAALKQLFAETGDARFATILALVRRPADSEEAYVAMVEENEIRQNLSHYERARIARNAAQAGVYPDTQAALRGLFASASRAKRSKIGSFVPVVAALDNWARFPTAIGERLGLKLAKALDADPGLRGRLRRAMNDTHFKTADAELALLERAVAEVARKTPGPQPAAGKDKGGDPVAPGIVLTTKGRGRSARIELSGPGVDDDLARALRDWLAARG